MRLLVTSVAMCVLVACAGGQPSAPSHPPPSEERAEPQAPAEAPAPDKGSCGGKSCVAPEQCIRYFGIAGPSLPLYTCGVPCDAQGECPDGLRCEAIADGPRLCK